MNIYNDLDNIFEFTSLVNTLELVLSNTKYNSEIEKYSIKTNVDLQNNNNKINEIFIKYQIMKIRYMV